MNRKPIHDKLHDHLVIGLCEPIETSIADEKWLIRHPEMVDNLDNWLLDQLDDLMESHLTQQFHGK